MSKRKSIGPVYASYPAREVGDWIGDKAFKIIASTICMFIWWGVYYVLIGVVNFNKNSFWEGSEETELEELFNSDISLGVLGVSSVIIWIYVFHSRVGSRQTRKRKH